MSIAKAIVSRPVLWLVVFALVAITGIFLLSGIAVEMYPEIEMPFLVIVTTYPGADPETVEKSVTTVLEAAVANTGGIMIPARLKRPCLFPHGLITRLKNSMPLSLKFYSRA